MIDGKGKHVYPGLIGAVTQLGLTEIGSVRASRDFAEIGDVTPEVRAAVAINPDSTLFPVTRANGVLSAGVFPTGGVIPGRASVIQLEGWTQRADDRPRRRRRRPELAGGRGGGRGRFGPAPERSEEDQARESNAAVPQDRGVLRSGRGVPRGEARRPARADRHPSRGDGRPLRDAGGAGDPDDVHQRAGVRPDPRRRRLRDAPAASRR